MRVVWTANVPKARRHMPAAGLGRKHARVLVKILRRLSARRATVRPRSMPPKRGQD
jgi:hypothetical protein